MDDIKSKKDRLRSIEQNLKSIVDHDSDKIEDNLKLLLGSGLVIGGSLFLTYKIVQLLTSKKKDKPKKSKKRSEIGFALKERLMAAAATVLYHRISKFLEESQQRIEQTLSDTEDTSLN